MLLLVLVETVSTLVLLLHFALYFRRPAVLAITIPHLRPVSFWTKSSLFDKSTTTPSLFKSTFLALRRGETIGVLPEGTSYTQPMIMQVKPEAMRAAVEFGKGVVVMVVPVVVVYTDKII